MKKIIHLSDLHIGYGDLGERFRRITDSIILLKQPAKGYVLVITGDIVENAFDGSQYHEAKVHIKKLKDAGYTVLVVPGNHDYGTGNLAHSKYVARFKRTFLGNAKGRYPRVNVIEGVAFIGLDSMAEEIHWYDSLFANGELGERQLGRLDKHLSKKGVRDCAYRVVYMHHHPFHPLPFHELKDSEELGKIVEKQGNVDAILFGHNHACEERNGIWNGIWNVPRCYDAGSATHKDDGAGYHRVIDLTRDPRWDYDGDF
jgi:3',5'-cyclic AMP phosphodiesterase CpdA